MAVSKLQDDIRNNSTPTPMEFISPSDVEASHDLKPTEAAATTSQEIQQGQMEGEQRRLAKKLRSRHMQMIAIGGSIGSGLFVGSGSVLRSGGPGSILIGFIAIGAMLLCTMQALGELAVLYPVNGAFYTYIVRFVDPSLGFAIGWNYALSWLTTLPFELISASITISFWNDHVNISVWITVFLVFIALVQVFGVVGYGETEFVLSSIKIMACIGFILFGIIVDCGGVSTDSRGYIGARYWHDPGAFRHGFKGFCSVFVNAAFAFSGTELIGLAAAEAKDPLHSLPKAIRQVFWRIFTFYILSLFIVGLIVPSDSPDLIGASGGHTKASPFVLAIKYAGVKGLPSVMNAVITISVISVANSCAYGSSRTIQAMATKGMAPRLLRYIDGKGRPLYCVIIQLFFGCLAYIGAGSGAIGIFSWLLATSGLYFLFIWGCINLAHIRFRHGWYAKGHTAEELPFQACFGIWGSYFGLGMCILALIATFYAALFPIASEPNAYDFFQNYLAFFVVLTFYLGWKIYNKQWRMFVRTVDMDIDSGIRPGSLNFATTHGKQGWWKDALRAYF